jgi:hypothetical protein
METETLFDELARTTVANRKTKEELLEYTLTNLKEDLIKGMKLTAKGGSSAYRFQATANDYFEIYSHYSLINNSDSKALSRKLVELLGDPRFKVHSNVEYDVIKIKVNWLAGGRWY